MCKTKTEESKSVPIDNKQWPQWLATISACIGLFLCGVSFSWSSPSLAILQSPDTPFNITNNEASWIASLLQFGAALGPVCGSLIALYFGPKMCILISAVPYFLGFLLIILARGPNLLYASRIITGMAVGMSFTASPIYISEIAEKHNRGALMLMFSLSMSTGALFICVVAPCISIVTMAEILSVFPVILLVTFIFAPESPYFYVRKNNDAKAIKSIERLRRQNNAYIIQDELNSIKEYTEVNTRFFDTIKQFFRSSNLKAFILVFLIISCQQVSGGVTISLYQEQLYASAGVPFDPSLGVIFSTILNIVAGFIAIFLTDKWGRKPLFAFSAIGCIVANILLGSYYSTTSLERIDNIYILPVVALSLLAGSFSLGLGPIPYTTAGEIFSGNVKEFALCLVSISGSLMGFTISKLFQVITDSLGGNVVFFGLATLTTVLLILTMIFVPETKNKSFHEIQNILKDPTYFIPRLSLQKHNIYICNIDK